MGSPTQSKINLVKAALAAELDSFGKNIADLEDCLQKAADDKSKGKGDKGKGVEEGMGIGLGLGLPKLLTAPFHIANAGLNVATTGVGDLAHTAAGMDAKLDDRDKVVSTINNQGKDVDRAMNSLRKSHPHLFNA